MTDLLRLGLTCNQKCIFCTVANDPEKDLTTEEAKEKIDFLAKNKCKILCVTGGEPTIREDLPKLIRYAKEKGIKKVELQTNGILLADKNYAKQLADASLDFALVALHSHKKDVSEELTQTKDTFEKTLKGIENLQEIRIATMISHVINSKNYRNLIDFVKFTLNILEEPYIYFGFVRPNGRAWQNKWIIPKLTEVELYLYKTFQYCKRNNISFSVEGVPLCYMQGYEKYNDEIRRIKRKDFHIEMTKIIDDTHRKIFLENKEKSKNCIHCKLNNICPGVWTEYAEIHGTDELFPIFGEMND